MTRMDLAVWLVGGLALLGLGTVGWWTGELLSRLILNKNWWTLKRWQWMLWKKHRVLWSAKKTEQFVRWWWAQEQTIQHLPEEERIRWWEERCAQLDREILKEP